MKHHALVVLLLLGWWFHVIPPSDERYPGDTATTTYFGVGVGYREAVGFSYELSAGPTRSGSKYIFRVSRLHWTIHHNTHGAAVTWWLEDVSGVIYRRYKSDGPKDWVQGAFPLWYGDRRNP